MRLNVNLFNVVLTGVSFLFLFTAFQAASLASQNVLEAAAREGGGSAAVGIGYISLALLYASFAICNWFAPVVLMLLGYKYTMFAGALCYVLFVASFFEPHAWSLYLASLLNGFGAAILWTAQGAFITMCSDESNSNLHFSIFWALFQMWNLNGRFSMESFFPAVLTIVFDCELLSLLFSQPVSRDYMTTCCHTFGRSFVLLRSKIMLAMLVPSGFTGLCATFQSSLFATCIGHTKAFDPNAKAYIGLVGVFIGLGEVCGSLLMQLRRWIPSTGLLAIIGYPSALISAFLCFALLPADSPMRDSDQKTYFAPNGLACCWPLLFGNRGKPQWKRKSACIAGQ
ncbi:Et translation product [Fasciola gigantica]|uniref:Et translation product n=1 Tax=Fasciola gigantica TaxID=46835 RepID=A0A504Z4C4_FASGI|nr:Et translation product [Fasciola gigantica]